MRTRSTFSSWSRESGQSLIETALILPLLLLLAFNAINFGYFFFVAINLAAAPRTGVQYSIVGSVTPLSTALPPVGNVSNSKGVLYLTFQDIKDVLPDYAKARVQVCSKGLGFSFSATPTAGWRTDCLVYDGGSGGSETYVPDADPESPATSTQSPSFFLNRVDVVYELKPLIPPFQLPTPGGPIRLALVPNLRFHRQVSMRAMD